MTEHQSGYAPINGLQMYYEVHGSGDPLLLLHGTYSAIGTSFGQLLPGLAKSRQVIGFDMQGHGRTADIDRPMRIEQLADDAAALLGHLGIERADVLGYSVGSAIGLQLAVRHPAAVRKLALVSVAYHLGGTQPGLMDNVDAITPEMFAGSPWHDEYLAIAPRPDDFPRLMDKVKEMNKNTPELTAEQFRAIDKPMLVIIGDADIIQPEHAVEMFRLLGGGPMGEMGLPKSSLAILPGTMHSRIMERADWLTEMINEFLDRT
jgi:pimeloyl-ACP methyl ester carboxylesterase